ncbi:MAG: hypothetical protein ACK4WD_07620 [Flavobacteriales bacterium]|jgi:hypothetical protein
MNKLVLSTALLFCFNVLVAQSELDELDKKYTPMSSGKEQLSDQIKSKVGTVHSGLSFEVMSLTRGQLSFEYQREIFVPSVVGFVSVGIPFSYDFVHRFYGSEFSSSISTENELSMYELYNNSSRISSSPWFQLGCRILFDEPGDLDGRGIELRYRRQKERLELSNSNSSGYDFSQIDSDVEFGHQTLFISYRAQSRRSSNSRFIYGLSYGVGFRMIDVPVVKYSSSIGMFTTSDIATYDGSKKEQTLISVLFTYTVGFGW